MSIKDFEILSTIGEGSYSKVYKVKRKSDDQIYALKKVQLKGLSEKERKNALNEVRILASIDQPNIIAYKEAFFDESLNTLNIVMEFADDGDLEEKIKGHRQQCSYFDESEIWNIFIQCLKGLMCLHESNILHRDLKCANVFLFKNGQIKLGDLNVSKVAKAGLVQTQTGTPYYASPEVWKDKPYDSRSDIWSIGCVLYEMTTLKPPFTAKDMKGLYMKVIRGNYPQIPKKYSTDLADVIAMCLQTSVIKRPTAEVLFNTREITRHIDEVKESSNDPALSPKTSLLNTIKLPKKLIDITKRLPKSNYSSPQYTVKKKVMDIKIAKGLPEIFEKPLSQLSKDRTKHISLIQDSYESMFDLKDVGKSRDAGSNEVSAILRRRLYQRVVMPRINQQPRINYSDKIKLPKIHRVSGSPSHNYSVNYSYRSHSYKRQL